MKAVCKDCGQDIAPEFINVATDLAQCQACGSVHKLSVLLGAESLSAKPKPVIDSPPVGSRLSLSKGAGGAIQISMKPKGFTLQEGFLSFFALFWLSFVTVWTGGALMASVFFALFSIPFWLVGFFLVGKLINDVKETQIVTLDSRTVTIEKKRPFLPKKHEVPYGEITNVKVHLESTTRRKNGPYTENYSPALFTGRETVFFFSGVNEASREWAVAFVSAIVEKRKA